MRENDQERNGHMKKQEWMKLLEEQKYSGMNIDVRIKSVQN